MEILSLRRNKDNSSNEDSKILFILYLCII